MPNVEEDDSPAAPAGNWRQTLEYFFFLVAGGLAWYLIVIKVLNGHHFPYHQYPVEVIFIIWGPIILLALILGVLDWTVKPKQD